ncbi:hypothetical protein ACFWXK_31565 [Streptomyces sp. NPDC059070]|uniref:hypothetical protein n=1 Tax=Streptomyces sp. NPDC059070 TaxID=3346713 RepID=UPI00369A5382
MAYIAFEVPDSPQDEPSAPPLSGAPLPVQSPAVLTGTVLPAERPPAHHRRLCLVQTLFVTLVIVCGIALRLTTAMSMREIVLMISALGVTGALTLRIATSRISTTALKRFARAWGEGE